MKKTTKISIVFDACFKSAETFESFRNRKPHWACYRQKEDLYYENWCDWSRKNSKCYPESGR